MIKLSEKGVSIIEALVATVIIGIGFVAVFQMTQYSVRSIDVSGERTKATYLSGMIAEDLYAEKNEETSGTKFMDSLASTPWELKKCDDSGTSDIPFPSFTGNHDSYKKKNGLLVFLEILLNADQKQQVLQLVQRGTRKN